MKAKKAPPSVEGASSSCTHSVPCPLHGLSPASIVDRCILVEWRQTRQLREAETEGETEGEEVDLDGMLRRLAEGGVAAACRDVEWLGVDVASRAAAIVRARRRLAALLEARGLSQRTPEWHDARHTMITASDVAQALGEGKFATQRAFFQKKCGYEAQTFDATLPPLKWGIMYEPVAAALYSSLNADVRVHEFGLLRHPDVPFLGASPDGITELGVMLEIKCPWRRRIAPGHVPMQYYYQIQVQLAVAGLSECDYFECEFEELDREAWEQLPPGRRRGAFVESLVDVDVDAPQPRYRYPPDPLDSDAAAPWVEATQPPPHRVHWWALRRWACCRVEIDPEFVNDTVCRLQDVWRRVIAYRADRGLYLADVPPAVPKPPVYAFLPDAEDT